MPTRNLGKTGFRVGLFSLGGQAALEKPANEAVAVPLIERALDLGVNYVDTSARYGGEARWSEQYFGQVMAKRRNEAFLATKTHDRTRDGSLQLLETSLKLLKTDHVDLWQLHAMSTMDDVEKVFAKGGALEAFREAREQKLVRFLGLSGHTDPAVLAEAIRRFPFDTILLAINAADPHHLPFGSELLPLAVEKEMGIIGMKIPARGRLLAGYVPPPLEEQRGKIKATRSGTLTMPEAMRYVLSLPVSTVIVGCDSVDAARGERGDRAGLHAAHAHPDGRARDEGRAGGEAVALVPPLGGVAKTKAASAGWPPSIRGRVRGRRSTGSSRSRRR